MHFRKITLIGVGLLGGSLGLAIRRAGLSDKVTGFVRRTESIADCLETGVVDEATCDLSAAVREADLIIFCTPISQMPDLARSMAPFLKPGALLTDVGSVKLSVVEEIEPIITPSGAFFIGSHPMAGSEKTGVREARVDLFDGAVCVITPAEHSNPAAITQIEKFWVKVGANPLILKPDRHDELVSRSSHLPHLIAAGLANYVLNPGHGLEQALLCASGFRDSTRIASGSPEMWRDIAMANGENLARVLGVFIEDLQQFQIALRKGDQLMIGQFFESAKRRRDDWLTHRVSSSPE